MGTMKILDLIIPDPQRLSWIRALAVGAVWGVAIAYIVSHHLLGLGWYGMLVIAPPASLAFVTMKLVGRAIRGKGPPS